MFESWVLNFFKEISGKFNSGILIVVILQFKSKLIKFLDQISSIKEHIKAHKRSNSSEQLHSATFHFPLYYKIPAYKNNTKRTRNKKSSYQISQTQIGFEFIVFAKKVHFSTGSSVCMCVHVSSIEFLFRRDISILVEWENMMKILMGRQ